MDGVFESHNLRIGLWFGDLGSGGNIRASRAWKEDGFDCGTLLCGGFFCFIRNSSISDKTKEAPVEVDKCLRKW